MSVPFVVTDAQDCVYTADKILSAAISSTGDDYSVTVITGHKESVTDDLVILAGDHVRVGSIEAAAVLAFCNKLEAKQITSESHTLLICNELVVREMAVQDGTIIARKIRSRDFSADHMTTYSVSTLSTEDEEFSTCECNAISEVSSEQIANYKVKFLEFIKELKVSEQLEKRDAKKASDAIRPINIDVSPAPAVDPFNPDTFMLNDMMTVSKYLELEQMASSTPNGAQEFARMFGPLRQAYNTYLTEKAAAHPTPQPDQQQMTEDIIRRLTEPLLDQLRQNQATNDARMQAMEQQIASLRNNAMVPPITIPPMGTYTPLPEASRIVIENLSNKQLKTILEAVVNNGHDVGYVKDNADCRKTKIITLLETRPDLAALIGAAIQSVTQLTSAPFTPPKAETRADGTTTETGANVDPNATTN